MSRYENMINVLRENEKKGAYLYKLQAAKSVEWAAREYYDEVEGAMGHFIPQHIIDEAYDVLVDMMTDVILSSSDADETAKSILSQLITAHENHLIDFLGNPEDPVFL
jgi:hypothetical protein